MRNRKASWRRTAAIGAGMALVFGGATAVTIGVSSAGERPAAQSAAPREDCGGLDTALRNNLNFIADQRRNPDALSDARIANRQAVVDLIQQRRTVAGCTADIAVEAPPVAEEPPATATAAPAPPTGASGDVVCAGNTVTLSGEEGGAPGALSNQFPVGTRLRVTNLDNNKSITVPVTGPSGSCALLNNVAFEQVREPGKFLIRRAVIERVG